MLGSLSGHLIVTILLCLNACKPVEAQVWDGDTFRIASVSGFEKIRISNIDAPEIEARCSFEAGLAQKAKLRLAELLQLGEVRVNTEKIDRYGRILATVENASGDIGDRLVAEGVARTWTGRREAWCRG